MRIQYKQLLINLNANFADVFKSLIWIIMLTRMSLVVHGLFRAKFSR